ncbi:hypothetical protein MHTCC0001_34640 [Flavobacteriaceae bacterium MHTCC 0001]
MYSNCPVLYKVLIVICIVLGHYYKGWNYKESHCDAVRHISDRAPIVVFLAPKTSFLNYITKISSTSIPETFYNFADFPQIHLII